MKMIWLDGFSHGLCGGAVPTLPCVQVAVQILVSQVKSCKRFASASTFTNALSRSWVPNIRHTLRY